MEHKESTAQTPLVVVGKTIEAPVEKVFAAFTDTDKIKEWWGPLNFVSPTATMKFEVGGKYLFEMCQADGTKDIWSTGTFLEIHPNERIIMSDAPSNSKGDVLNAKEAGIDGPFPDQGEGYITVEFVSLHSNGTKLVISHEGLPAKMHDECLDGWSQSLDKLKKLVETN